uniref:Uncharacterized protein n=1 Tax=Knipowitschia caucasica TaxID=637954 RepID=A0AAV2LCH1_KNICA
MLRPMPGRPGGISSTRVGTEALLQTQSRSVIGNDRRLRAVRFRGTIGHHATLSARSAGPSHTCPHRGPRSSARVLR